MYFNPPPPSQMNIWSYLELLPQTFGNFIDKMSKIVKIDF